MNGRLEVGQLGTFDVENYGDLLYPVLLERMFRQRNDTGKIRRFSLMGSKSLQDSRYDTRPIQQLFASQLELPHTLIVGGGDLLRTDWHTVASHYRSICSQQNGQSSTSLWQRLFKKRSNRELEADHEFRHHYMNYPAVGPFIIEPDGILKIKSVAYCSCGVPFPFDKALKHRIADTFNKSVFLYVRDHQSRDALLQAGVKCEIHVGPDLVTALSDFFDAAQEREKGRAMLEDRGVDIQRRILCFQSHPQSRKKNTEVVKQLKSYQRRTGCEVVLLPLGSCHGDRKYLKRLAQYSGGAFKYVELVSIYDIIAVLAACDVFLGTSLHGNITAFSFGIPHVFGPIQVAKREGFLEVTDLPSDLKMDSWSEVNQKLELATGLGREFFAARAIAAKRRVHEVFDLLLRAVRSV